MTSAGANRLTVVSDSPLSGLGVQKLKSFSATVITPAEYQAQARHDGVFVFHRTLPNQFPASNALFVLPPPGSQLGGSLKQADAIEIIHWSEDLHRIVNYLNVPMPSAHPCPA